MKKSLGICAVIIAALMASSASYAGLKSGYEVRITTSGTTTTAAGSVGKARNSVDTSQYIFCYTRDNTFGYCAARTVDGLFKACLTSDANKISVIRSIGVSSGIVFKTTGTSTNCSTVQVVNGSHLQPATP